MTKPKKYYLNNKDLYIEIIVSKEAGRLTREATSMLEILGKQIIKRFYYHRNDDKWDCYQHGMYVIFKNWQSFNEHKSVNAFAYYTEVFKRGAAQGFNDLYKKRGDNDNLVQVISLDMNWNNPYEGGVHSL